MILNIGQRILASFALIIALTMGLGIYQMSKVGEMRDLASEIVETDFTVLNLLRQVAENQDAMRIYNERAKAFAYGEKAGLAVADTEVAQGQWTVFQQRTYTSLDELVGFLTSRKSRSTDPGRVQLYSQLEEVLREERQVLSEISTVVQTQFELVKRGQLAELRPHAAVLDELRAKFNDVTRRSAEIASRLSVSAGLAIDARRDSMQVASVIALALVVAVGSSFAWLLYQSINRPLTAFMSFVDRVGRGDLTQKTSNTGQDEFGRLGQTLNAMVDGLASTARQSREATVQLNSATSELQASAKQQGASTSEQSAAIQQITATLEEITQSGSQISDRAKSVAATAEATSASGTVGMEAVAAASDAMASISEQAQAVASNIVALTEKAQSIGEIIASVNDIAERSNLLALNAAIEAAAAGENGLSFVVVADEMKNLANQAQESTGQVRALLSDIQKGISASVMQTEEAVKRAEAGQHKTTQAEQTIRGLVESVEDSVSAFQQIVAATNQQQIGVQQAAQSIQDIRVSSEQMAQGIRSLEQAAVNLGSLGGQLQQSVERYVV